MPGEFYLFALDLQLIVETFLLFLLGELNVRKQLLYLLFEGC